MAAQLAHDAPDESIEDTNAMVIARSREESGVAMLAQRGHRRARIKARQAVKVGGPPRANGAVVRAREDAPILREHSEGTQRALRGHSERHQDGHQTAIKVKHLEGECLRLLACNEGGHSACNDALGEGLRREPTHSAAVA